MSHDRNRLAALTAALLATCVLLPVPAKADDGESFSGKFIIGYRSVSVDGRVDKFKEDFNLDDGPRLFDLSVNLVPTEGYRKFVDSIHLDATNLGGDPFETLSFGARKSNAFDFSYRRTKDTYFYNDIILPPELADVRMSSGGDFHTFNFDRIRDTADLKIHLSQRAKLNFGFDRFTKVGDSTTTLDLQRDEYELDKPINESMNAYNGGLEYAWDKVTLSIEENVRKYDNAVEIFLPGFSLGENTAANSSSLDLYFLDQPYSYDSNQTTARIIARPNDRLLIKLAASTISLDLDVTASERSKGTTPQGQPFTAETTGGNGKVSRDTDLYDLNLSYRINDRLAIIGGGWSRSLDQDGRFLFGTDTNLGRWKIDTTGGELGLEVSVSSQLTLTGGFRSESRDVKFQHNEGDPTDIEVHPTETTDHTGYFASLGWVPSKELHVTAEFEDNSYDDPFTLASPTDQQRYRVRAQYHLGNGFSVVGSYLSSTVDNNNSGWSSDSDQSKLSLAYARKDLSASVGYSNVSLKRRVDRTVNYIGDGSALFNIDYKADADFYDGHLRYSPTSIWTVGGDFLFYDNSGSFGLKRDDYRGFVEFSFKENYLVNLGYRHIKYDEDRFNFDDYKADIAEFGIGFRWK